MVAQGGIFAGMPSAFAHALAAVSVSTGFSGKAYGWKFWILGIICAVIPDADVLTFNFGIPYAHFLGHRGFSHSLFFALLFAITITLVFYRKIKPWNKQGLLYIFFFFLCMSSHALLDMFTNGGLGIAIFSPFDTTRYFFPWRPIQVSPIGAHRFFSEWGLRVIKSELIWVGIPCGMYMLIQKGIIKIRSNK